jgi:Protein of unknown function (DUF3592)
MTTTDIFNLLLLAILISLVFYHFIYKNILKLIEIRRIKKNGQKVLATIVETKKTRGSDGQTFFHAVFRYTTNTGQIITTQSKYAKGIKPEIGEEVTIYYLPSSPEKYYIPKSIPYEIIPIMLATPGLIFCVFELLKIAHLYNTKFFK